MCRRHTPSPWLGYCRPTAADPDQRLLVLRLRSVTLSQTDRKGIAAVVQGHDGMLLLLGESGLREKSLEAPKPQG